jgi:quinol monooxygenase YgiN
MNGQEGEHYVVVVEFDVNESDVDTFLDAIKQNSKESLENEAGCLQFDVLVSSDRANSILLYEVYTDEQSFIEHTKQDHYKAFLNVMSGLTNRKSVRIYRPARRMFHNKLPETGQNLKVNNGPCPPLQSARDDS